MPPKVIAPPPQTDLIDETDKNIVKVLLKDFDPPSLFYEERYVKLFSYNFLLSLEKNNKYLDENRKQIIDKFFTIATNDYSTTNDLDYNRMINEYNLKDFIDKKQTFIDMFSYLIREIFGLKGDKSKVYHSIPDKIDVVKTIDGRNYFFGRSKEKVILDKAIDKISGVANSSLQSLIRSYLEIMSGKPVDMLEYSDFILNGVTFV